MLRLVCLLVFTLLVHVWCSHRYLISRLHLHRLSILLYAPAALVVGSGFHASGCIGTRTNEVRIIHETLEIATH